jgi:heme exporter protein B
LTDLVAPIEAPAAAQTGLASVCACLVRREFVLALRRPADALGGLGFFVIVASLFPLGVGPDAAQLESIGAGVLWVAALLACMLSLPRLFAADQADGTLDQLLLAPQPLPVLVAAKVLAHWAVAALPLLLAAPLLAVQYRLPGPALATLVAALLLGTPVLFLVGAVVAALTLGLRGGSALLALLVLPLDVPVLIFGAGAVDASVAGLPTQAHLALLGACLAGALAFAPWAAAVALRLSLE